MSASRIPAGYRARDDRGSVSVIAVFIVLIAGVVATFVIDVGARVSAAAQAETYASEAARAGAIAVGPTPGPGSAQQAAAAAQQYLSAAGVSGTVSLVGPAEVRVVVTVSGATPILGMPYSQQASRTAQLQVGVSDGGPIG